jgi:Subtilase family/Fervidolysin N-terminal prodomain/IPT/TIG domain
MLKAGSCDKDLGGGKEMAHKLHSLLVLFFVLFVPCSLFAGEFSRYREGEVLVKFKDYVRSDVRREQAIGTMGMTMEKYFPINGFYLIKVSSVQPAEQAVKSLKSNPDIEYAEPNYERHISGVTPNDPLFISQWAHQNIHSTDVWQVTTGSSDILIAVSDSGVDYTHNDLKANIWGGIGFNALTGTNAPMDDEGHGTHVAGIIGAVGNNGIGVTGMNWKTSIMALKFISADGTGTVANEIETIQFAKDNGARVFNMSFGSNDFSTPEMEAIQNAGEILFVASAGNESVDNDIIPTYPANYDLPNIISVAASDPSDQLAFFSNYGRSTVSVAAPGINILSTVPGDNYENMSGTSMSAPFVSGLAGLVLAESPGLTVSQVKDQILRTADAIPYFQGLSLTGGRINAYRALSQNVTGPFVYAISPGKGPQGSNVTIRGSRFEDSAGQVFFPNNVAAPIVSWSNEKIVATVPDEAVTGSVYVATAEGSSNAIDFEVTPYPTNVRVAFPHVPIEAGELPLLIISNPIDQPATIYINIVEANAGDETLKIVQLNKFEKRIFKLGNYGPAGDSLYIECESQGFFGAAAIMVFEDPTRIIAMPPLFGGPLHLVGGITPK